MALDHATRLAAVSFEIYESPCQALLAKVVEPPARAAGFVAATP